MTRAIDLLRNSFGVSQLYQYDVKKEGKTIKGTDEKTASATLDTTKKQVKEKIDNCIKKLNAEP